MNKSRFGFYAGILIFALPFLVDPLFEGLSINAWRTMGLAGMMALWWVTECVPIPVTSFLPLVGPVAVAFGESPVFLAIPAAGAASCAFMLPVATPPNAIVFSSGELRVSEMARAGFWLNVIAVALLVLSSVLFLPYVF